MSENLWIQLGVAGATLFILFIFGKTFLAKIFELLGKKLDNLVDSFNKIVDKLSDVAINTARDQKETNEHLKLLTGIAIETQKQVALIYDRTSRCGVINVKEVNDNGIQNEIQNP